MSVLFAVFSALALVAPCAYSAEEVPQSFTYQGRFMNAAGTTPVADGTYTVRFKIFSETGSCLLYHEQQDIITTNGFFSVQLGSPQGAPPPAVSGNRVRSATTPAPAGGVIDPGLTMEQVFSNKQTGRDLSANGTCSGAYTPALGEKRKLQVENVTLGVTLSPDQVIGSVPNAIVAESIQGLRPENFVQIYPSGVPTATTLTANTYALDGNEGLIKLWDGTAWSSVALVSTSNLRQMGASGGNVLKWNGTSWMPAADNDTFASASASGDLSGSFASTLTVVGLQGRAMLATAPTTGQAMIWNGAAWAPTSLSGTSGTAGGDLAGSYPSPSVVKLQGTAVSTMGPGSGELLRYNGSAWTPWTATYLNTGDSAGGDLSGTYPNPSVAKLQGRTVNAAVPTAGQVLMFMGGEWVPAPASSLTGISANYVNRDGDTVTGNYSITGNFSATTLSSTSWLSVGSSLIVNGWARFLNGANFSGSTISGVGAPMDTMDAVNRMYVDGLIAGVSGSLSGANYVSKAGDSMSGALAVGSSMTVWGNVGIGTAGPETNMHINLGATVASGQGLAIPFRINRTQIANTWGQGFDLKLYRWEDTGGVLQSRSAVKLALGHGATDSTDTDILTLRSDGFTQINGSTPALIVGSPAAGSNFSRAAFSLGPAASSGNTLTNGLLQETAQIGGVAWGQTFGQKLFRWQDTGSPLLARTAVTFSLGHGSVAAPDVDVLTFRSDGNVGIGTTSPSARLHVIGSSANSNSAPIKFSAGTLMTSAEAGAIEYDGANFYVTDGTATRRTIATSSGTGGDFVLKSGDTMIGSLTLPAGVAAAPSLSIGSDSSTGFFSSGAGTLSLVSKNGKIAMTATTAGFIGIGELDPQAPIQINNPAVSGMAIKFGNNAFNNSWISFDNMGGLSFTGSNVGRGYTFASQLGGFNVNLAGGGAFKVSTDALIVRQADKILSVGTTLYSGQITIASQSATRSSASIFRLAGQSSNLLEFLDSSSTTLSFFDAYGALNMSGNTIKGVSSPSDSMDAANRQYVDDLIAAVSSSLTSGNYVSRIGDSMSGRLLISPVSSPSSTVFAVRASVGQTAYLQTWESSTGAPLAFMNSSGDMTVNSTLYLSGISENLSRFSDGISVNAAGAVLKVFGNTNKSLSPGAVSVTGVIASHPVFVARGVAAQSANIAEFQNNSGTTLSAFDQLGGLNMYSNSIYGLALPVGSADAVRLDYAQGIAGGLGSYYVRKSGDMMLGGLMLPRGTVALPALSFSSDVSTGFFSSGAGTLAIATAGTQTVTVTPTGLVGIGTTAPVSKLTVSQAATISYPTPGLTTGSLHLKPSTTTAGDSSSITFGSPDAGAGDTPQAGIYVQGSGGYGTKMYFGTTNLYGTGSQSRMMIDHLGNVGIGTIAPTTKLEVNGTVKATAFSGGSIISAGDSTLSYPTMGTSTGTLQINPTSGTNDNTSSIVFGANSSGAVNATGQAGIYVQSSGAYGTKMYFGTSNSFGTGSQSRMMINHLGNVGIGTTTPDQALTVSGGLRIGNTSSSSSGTIRFTGSTFEGWDGTQWQGFGGPTRIYVVGGTFVGTLNPGQILSQHPFPVNVTIPSGCTSSRLEFKDAATANTYLTLQKCTGAGFSTCTQFGTATVVAGSKVATFTCASATSFVAGTDSLIFLGSGTADATAGTAGFAIYGTR